MGQHLDLSKVHARRQVIAAYPVFSGGERLGKILAFDAPPDGRPAYDAIALDGAALGSFGSRGDAAVAIAAATLAVAA